MLLAQIPTAAPADDSSIFGGVALVLLFLLIVPVASAFFTAWLAMERGRKRETWFVLGFFFGPIALLALGFAPDGRPGPPAQRAAPARADEPPPSRARVEVEPPAPVPQRVPPSAPMSYERPPPPSRSIPIEVDGVAFHEGSRQAYGRGRDPGGEIIYFQITSPERYRELTDELATSRPARWSIEPQDVVPFGSLPPELQG